MPTTRTAFAPAPLQAQLNTPWAAWRLGWMVSELWMTSAYNILSRTAWLSGADPTQGAPLREWQRMWSEKVGAGLEVAMQMQRAGSDLVLGRFDPLQSSDRLLRPLHRRAVANTRRLARRNCFRD